MAPPVLRFAIDEPVAVYLDRFPDLAAWLRAAGYSLPVGDESWCTLSINPAVLLDAVAASVSRPRWDETTDWAQESLTDLVHHLIEVHHGYLRAEIPRLAYLAAGLARDHRDVAVLGEAFAAFGRALLAHLDQEEGELFPLCLAIDQTRFGLTLPPSDLLRARLHHLDNDHIERKADLDVLFSHRPHLQGLDDARASAWLAGMEALALDLAVHADEETTILMPAVTHLHDLLDSRRIGRRTASNRSPPEAL